MKKIDSETVQRILDTAEIVDVVSDYVSLHRRGAGYIGLCPFHNERTPSFSVSPARNYCKCFSCGKGGSPVHFIMELEQMSFGEALRYLAKKYRIEITEDEPTAEEREAESERASMFALNEFARSHFSSNLLDNPDGRAIGLAYFRERGINEAMIKRFGLGYSLDKSKDLYTAALRKGFNEKYLVDTGLCIRTDRGDIYDRFKGRVMYPIYTVSGKVVGFGGRTLSTSKEVAKYQNSPESAIYHKHLELYGLYQAKQAIRKREKCILVEGYMDVISMHQAGVENVVASSGTSLTPGQVRLIHRFTDNVTVIYDSDAAGIKASLRGIDMLLAEGLNIKVVLLPDGDDPDSFAQNHTATEVEEYLVANEADFITFKSKILLADAGDSPLARAKVINDVLQSVSVIPDRIVRDSYVQQCARMFGVDDDSLNFQVAKFIAQRLEKESKERLREQNRRKAGLSREETAQTDTGTTSATVIPADPASTPTTEPGTQEQDDNVAPLSPEMLALGQLAGTGNARIDRQRKRLYIFESNVLKCLVKYGMLDFCTPDGTIITGQGSKDAVKLVDALESELHEDNLNFSDPGLQRLYQAILHTSRATWEHDIITAEQTISAECAKAMDEGLERLRNSSSGDLGQLKANEIALNESIEHLREKLRRDFRLTYLERKLMSDPDDTVRNLASALAAEKYQLSKVHTKYATIEADEDRLGEIVPRALAEWRDAILALRLDMMQEEIKGIYPSAPDAKERLATLMADMAQIMEMRKEFAKYLGERVVMPR